MKKSEILLPQQRKIVRAMTHDHMMTYDNRVPFMDNSGNQRGKTFDRAYQTHDGRTVDSTGAFLVGELERLDQTMHAPLMSVSYGRDVDMRDDVTIADEVSSFTLTNFGSAGGLGTGNGIGNGKSWIGKSTDQVPGQGVDIAKIVKQLNIWGQEIKYTIPELESAARLGRPVDQQKYEALQYKHQMDIDEQVYIGDTPYQQTGLVNNAGVTNVQNVVAGASGFTFWATKSPDEILADFNTALSQTWQNSGWAIYPSRVLIPPTQFGLLSTNKVSNAGNISILKYVQENNILTASTGRKLDIFPLKWCIGAGVGGTIGTADNHDRMVVYTKEYKIVRYPMTMLQRTPIQYDSLYHKTTYFCRLGEIEIVRSECFGYYDGI